MSKQLFERVMCIDNHHLHIRIYFIEQGSDGIHKAVIQLNNDLIPKVITGTDEQIKACAIEITKSIFMRYINDFSKNREAVPEDGGVQSGKVSDNENDG